MELNLSVPSVGFIPERFPRDPVEINTYLEHMAVGQVLESIVTCNQHGIIAPGLAQKWTISPDGKTLVFALFDGLFFSNGLSLGAADVKFSIERHIHAISQSKPFLQCLEKITVISPLILEFKLSVGEPAFIKALSRDHVGIVPQSWTFDSQNAEPYIGTGPYRVIKRDGNWHYLLNEKYRNKSDKMIPNWRILLSDTPLKSMESGIMPDYMPLSSRITTDEISKLMNSGCTHNIEPAVHFAQASAWWNPYGANVNSKEIKYRSMCAFKNLVDLRRKELGFEIATGVIPKGVEGYLEKPFIGKEEILDGASNLLIKVRAASSELDLIFDKSSVLGVENRLNVKFVATPVDLSKVADAPEQQPDIIIGSWFGACNDPEGFIAILTHLLKINLTDYFGNLSDLYLRARRELDSIKRADLYQELNVKFLAENMMVPIWKCETFCIARRNLLVTPSSFRYSPGLADVEFAQNI